MRIGILGSGLMGGKLGTIFARAGHEVVFSYARSGRKLERPARKLPRSRIVSAFNTVPSEVLFGVHRARRRAKRPSLVYCGGAAALFVVGGAALVLLFIGIHNAWDAVSYHVFVNMRKARD